MEEKGGKLSWDKEPAKTFEHAGGHSEEAQPRLEDWSLSKGGGGSGGSIYTAPELRPVTLSGVVYNHPVKPDGAEVGTSALRSLSFENGAGVACTANRAYILGRMAKDYKDYRREKGLSVSNVSFAASF